MVQKIKPKGFQGGREEERIRCDQRNPGLDKLLADIKKIKGKNELNGEVRGHRVIMGKMDRIRKAELKKA